MTEQLHEKRTVSDVIIAYLEQIGVEYVFGIPGGHIASLYESLYRSEERGGPRAVMNRHESGAAFMAAGYALETGKIGVCFTTAGPGATNIITGVAEAYATHIPLLVITGQTILPPSGRGALQECAPFQGQYPDIIDTVSMLEHCTCYNSTITHPAQVEQKLAAALISAHQPLQGPAHLGIPADILRGPGAASLAYPGLSQLLDRPAPSCFVDMPAIEELHQVIRDVLEKNQKIALFIGYECAGAVSEIIEFAELLNAPIVTSLRGKGKVDPYHPLVRGVFGVAGHQSAREALADESVGLILAVGTSLGQMATAGWNSSLLNEKLVHIHHSTVYFPRSPMARLHVCGTASAIFQELTARLVKENNVGELKKVSTEQAALRDEKNTLGLIAPPQITLQIPDAYQDISSPIKPQRLMYELMQKFPPETRFLIDNGTAVEWTIHYFFLRNYTNYRLVSTAPCSMGWAPGSAVGTALGNPGTPVVCIVGDASYLMYGHEISVAVSEQVPVIFVILNDSAFGAVKHRNRQIGTVDLEFALQPTDFTMMAKAVGAVGYSIKTPEDFIGLDFDEICTRSGPTVLDIYIDPEESPPIDQ